MLPPNPLCRGRRRGAHPRQRRGLLRHLLRLLLPRLRGVLLLRRVCGGLEAVRPAPLVALGLQPFPSNLLLSQRRETHERREVEASFTDTYDTYC